MAARDSSTPTGSASSTTETDDDRPPPEARDGLDHAGEDPPSTSDAPTELGWSAADAPTELGASTRPRVDPTWPRVGRYELRSRIGSGATGAVYEARDPSLDRVVAVKVLHTEMPEVARRRMQREALSLAKLSHPHVVQVFEVGEDDGRTFIAMELVRGQTLATWARRQPPPSWRECLEVYVQAVTGLAAAHAAALVHRDFKPSNCILGDDGRVRVVDFGLAKHVGDDDEQADTEAGSPAADLVLTHHGALLGTPAYMAPEQLAGRAGGPAGDQFALCVSLWEALHQRRPFVGETLAELSLHILRGELAAPPAGARVPRWLRAVVVRGLAVEPERRWPSMQALSSALEHGRARARRRSLALVLGGMAATVAAIVALQRHDEHTRTRACEAEGRAIEQVWNADAQAAMRAAMVGTGLPRAELTVDKVTPWLDAHASAWQADRTEACLDAEVRRSWDADTLERAQWCFDERRMELEALLVRLGSGDRRAVDGAVNAASSLRRVEPCRDPVGLSWLPTPPADARDQVREIRAELSQARASARTGDYERGLEVAERALARAQALAWPPLTSETRLQVALLLDSLGQLAEAESTYEQAFFEAVRANATDVATDTAGHLAYLLACRLRRVPEARRWWRHEDALLPRVSDPLGLGRARVLDHLGSIDVCDEAPAAAKASYEQALAIRSEALGSDHLAVLKSIGNLAGAHRGMAELEQAKRLYQQSLVGLEAVLGPEHPDVATALNNLAAVSSELGEHEVAQALMERLLAVQERTLGPEHLDLASTLNNLAAAHQVGGADKTALALHERALAIRERALGPEHPDVANSLTNVGLIHLRLGSFLQARAELDRAVRLLEAALGPEHPELARSLVNLASVHQAQGEHERADAVLTRVLRIQEATRGPDHPEIAGTLVNLGNGQLAMGRLEQAQALHERALAIFERSLGPEHTYVALSLTNLAGVHRATGAHEQARAEYERALSIWERSLGPEHPNLASPLGALASIALEQGRVTDAVTASERAVRLCESGDVEPRVAVAARFGLAKGLWAAGQDRERARALAREALGSCEALGPACSLHEAMRQWLDERGR